jgi:hypothetical protein
VLWNSDSDEAGVGRDHHGDLVQVCRGHQREWSWPIELAKLLECLC